MMLLLVFLVSQSLVSVTVIPLHIPVGMWPSSCKTNDAHSLPSSCPDAPKVNSSSTELNWTATNCSIGGLTQLPDTSNASQLLQRVLISFKNVVIDRSEQSEKTSSLLGNWEQTNLLSPMYMNISLFDCVIRSVTCVFFGNVQKWGSRHCCQHIYNPLLYYGTQLRRLLTYKFSSPDCASPR